MGVDDPSHQRGDVARIRRIGMDADGVEVNRADRAIRGDEFAVGERPRHAVFGKRQVDGRVYARDDQAAAGRVGKIGKELAHEGNAEFRCRRLVTGSRHAEERDAERLDRGGNCPRSIHVVRGHAVNDAVRLDMTELPALGGQHPCQSTDLVDLSLIHI